MDYKELKKKCLVWADMVYVNNRPGALLAVADFFRMPALSSRLRDIDRRQDKIGYCRCDVFVDRTKVEKEMFGEIRRLYGDDIYNMVKGCFKY